MKLVWTVLYIAAVLATMFLGNKLVGTSMKRIRAGRQQTLLGLAAGTAMLVLSFVQFFCLTGMFPLQLVLLLVLASLLGVGIYHAIGAVAGFTLPEKQQKISALQVIMGQQRPVSGCIGTALSSLVFPLWLLRPEVETYFTHRGWPIPPFWLPLSLPILLFIAGSLVPFFIGVYRYRSQARVMSQWEEKWMREVLPVLKLPVGSTRAREIDDRLAKLGQEVEERISSNEEVFRYYQTITVGTAEAEPAPPAVRVLDTTAQSQPAEPAAAAAIPTAEEPSRDPRLLLPQRIASLQRLVPRPLRPPPRDDANLAETVQSIVRMHIAKLEEWDIRFAYLRRLIQLGQVVSDGRTNEVSGFVEARLKGETLGTESARPNMTAAWVISLLASAIPLLAKKYETEILNLIGRLV